jgi:Phage integrase, N-terminal
MSAVDDLQHSINNLFPNRENSYVTHAGRRFILNGFSKDLISLGFSLRNINGLKPKHILAVLT